MSKKHIASFLLLALVFFFSSILSLQAQPIADQTLFLTLRVTEKTVTVKSTHVKQLPFYPVTSNPTDPFRFTLLSAGQKELYSQLLQDPLVHFEDDFSDPARPKGGKKTMAETGMFLKIPSLKEATYIRFERLDPSSGKWSTLGTSPLPQP